MISLRVVLLLFFLLGLAESFSPLPSLNSSSGRPLLQLEASRMNAKKEKVKRNRENMRKFKVGGRKGLSRRKLLKKSLSSKARVREAEFIAKCFITVAPPIRADDDVDESSDKN